MMAKEMQHYTDEYKRTVVELRKEKLYEKVDRKKNLPKKNKFYSNLVQQIKVLNLCELLYSISMIKLAI